MEKIMIKSPNLMSLAEQAKLFREGKLTAVNNVKSHLEIINNLNKITIEDYKPDLTILLDIDPNISSNRINKSVNIELSSLEKSKKNKI